MATSKKLKDFAFDLVAAGERIAEFTFWKKSWYEMRRTVSRTCMILQEIALPAELQVAQDDMFQALEDF